MNYDADGWGKTVKKTPSRWATPAWIAFGLIVAAVSTIGMLSPSGPPAPKPHPGEDITTISTELLVQPDGTVLVTENTRINLQGQVTRHGITRRLPTVYLKENKNEQLIRYGEQYASIELLEPYSTPPERTQVSPFGNEKKFVTYRIGSETAVLAPGTYQFMFQFAVHGIVHAIDGEKATGFSWDVTEGLLYSIPETRVRLKLPPFLDPQTVHYGAYVGFARDAVFGQEAANLNDVSSDVSVNFDNGTDGKGTYLNFRATRPLKPYEHFIINVSWPPGFVDGGL